MAQDSTDDLARRVRELEETVRKLQGERPPAVSSPVAAPTEQVSGPGSEQTSPVNLPANPTPFPNVGADQPELLAGWSNGFFLRSADKAYQLRITGQIQTDYRAFLDGPDATDIDSFLVRRARLGIEANMFEYYEFRLLPDFGLGQPRIQDSYLNVHYWDVFQVEAGKFKQPFSYEQLIQDRFVPTMERSLIDQLAPARDVGLMVHGQRLLDNRFDYACSVSNGQINGDFDINDPKDVVGRVAYRPFGCGESPLQFFQIGLSASTGVEQEPIQPATLRTPATVPWFQFNSGVRASGLRNRYSPEISCFLGPLGFAAQYFFMEQEISPVLGSPLVTDVPFEGFYVLATCLLTGEVRTSYSEAIDPLVPFDPRKPHFATGAWELVARVSRLAIGREVFQPGAAQLSDPTLFSSGATELTLGFNWYLNQWARVQVNWEHAWFDQPVRLDPSGSLSRQDTLLSRFQIIF
jgi:phosphate-selective porin OprO/OprP